MNFLDIFQLMLGLFIPMSIGFFMYKTHMVDKNFTKGVSKLLYNVSLPCSILQSMLVKIPLKELVKSASLPFISVIVIILGFILAKLVAPLIEKDKRNHGLIWFSFLFSNFTFTSYPILENLYDAKAVFYASIFNLGMFVGVLTIGAYSVKKSSKNDADCSFSLKDLFSIPFFALLLGMILLFIPVTFPKFITTSIASLGATTTPLGVILTGLVLAKSEKLNLIKLKYYVVAFVRLLLIPLAVVFILKAIGFTGHMIYVPAIILANPIAVNLVIFSETYEADTETSASYVLISSLLSIITLPIVCCFI